MKRKSIAFVIIAALLLTLASFSMTFADTAAPGQVTVKSVKAKTASSDSGKASVTVKWKKLSAKKRKKIKGYEIQYSTRSDFADSSCLLKTATKSKTGRKITKLARKKNYYIRIRSYKWIGGVKHVSKWSSAKRVRTK